jgi:hypothetical protein
MVLQLAFPNYQTFPPKILQCSQVLDIPRTVPIELGHPISQVGLRNVGVPAPVLMPETSVDEDSLAQGNKR